MYQSFILGLSVFAGATAALAQDHADVYQGDRFAVTVEEIAPGVHVMRRDPSWRLPVQANTTLIVNEDDAVLIDGGFGAHAGHVVQEVLAITSNPVSLIINTHWHGDHNVGHHVFKDVWPDARILAHEETRRLMVEEDVMAYVAETGAITDDEELLGPRRARVEELEADGAPAEIIAYQRDAIEGQRQVRDDYADWVLVPADITFSRRLTLHRAGRRIEVLHFGPANTPGDALIWLPDERVVLTGDTVVRPTPYGFGSRPASWAQVLEEINALDYDILVPGHGDIQRDTAYVDLLIRTMTMVAEGACAAVGTGGDETDAEAVYDAIAWESVEADFTGDRPLLSRLFEVWFKRPISRGALDEIEESELRVCR